eukprot:scaffold25009_cov71-Cyclotella_meneghiniana.AAC.6
MESGRKISQALIEGERIAAEEELIESIEDPNLMQQQQIIAKIGRHLPRREDYEELRRVMEVPHEERRMFSEKELAVFKPKPLSGNFTKMKVTLQTQPTRVIPASSHQTGVIPICTVQQYAEQNQNSQLARVAPASSHPIEIVPTRSVKQEFKSPTCTIKFVAETSKLGLLIGTKHCNIKNIERTTSCKININGKSSKYGGYSSATIIGNEDQCKRAKEMINALVRARKIGMFFVS